MEIFLHSIYAHIAPGPGVAASPSSAAPCSGRPVCAPAVQRPSPAGSRAVCPSSAAARPPVAPSWTGRCRPHRRRALTPPAGPLQTVRETRASAPSCPSSAARAALGLHRPWVLPPLCALFPPCDAASVVRASLSVAAPPLAVHPIRALPVATVGLPLWAAWAHRLSYLRPAGRPECRCKGAGRRLENASSYDLRQRASRWEKYTNIAKMDVGSISQPAQNFNDLPIYIVHGGGYGLRD